ncbi:MAG: purine-binding chemotaxis protein CheW [Nitrospinae bacterium]|nr:purine-binding chemotaxis protein CheW [Nitrospinota bacterium]
MGRFRVRREQRQKIEEPSLQFIGIILGAEEYMLDIKRVREIIMLEEITHVPRVQEFIEGVINLRGEVVPVINLRVKLGMATEEFSPRSRIIIVEAGGGMAGFLVDAVTSVMRLPESVINYSSSALGEVSADYIKAIGRAGGRILGWMDVDKLCA